MVKWKKALLITDETCADDSIFGKFADRLGEAIKLPSWFSTFEQSYRRVWA